jgi:hypothetical protein
VACRETATTYLCGVLGIFRPKKTKFSGGRATLGLQRGITFQRVPISAQFEQDLAFFGAKSMASEERVQILSKAEQDEFTALPSSPPATNASFLH